MQKYFSQCFVGRFVDAKVKIKFTPAEKDREIERFLRPAHFRLQINCSLHECLIKLLEGMDLHTVLQYKSYDVWLHLHCYNLLTVWELTNLE
jgi:hypothetical protein